MTTREAQEHGAKPRLEQVPGMTRHIVIRLCNWVGDVVMSIPALQLLSSHGFGLHLYGKAWAQPLLSGYDWPVQARASSLRERVVQLRQLHKQLQTIDTGFDGRVNALTMPRSFSSALELRLAGFRSSGLVGDGRTLMLAHRQRRALAKEGVEGGPHTLEALWHLALGLLQDMPGVDRLAPPANIGMRVSSLAQTRVRASIIDARGWHDGFICVLPFAAGTLGRYSKKWPVFPELVRHLAESQSRPVVICPGPGEQDEARALYPTATILECLPLDDYAALLKQCSLAIANDTGPAHLAAAVNAPLLSVLGPTNPARYAPWGSNVQVIRRWPEWPDPEEVLQAAQKQLQRQQQ